MPPDMREARKDSGNKMPFTQTQVLDEEPAVEKMEGIVGVDSFTRNTILPNEISPVMENAITKDNAQPQTRYGFISLNDAAFDAAKAQGLGWFDAYVNGAAVQLLVVAANAAMYKWDGAAKTALAGYTPSNATALVEMAMGINKLYLVDGVQDLFSFDGTTFAKIDSTAPANQNSAGGPPKAAGIILWHTGLKRLLLSGVATNPDTVWASDILNASLGAWDWIKWSFQASGGEGEAVTALFELPQGTLGVGKSNSIKIYSTPAGAASIGNWELIYEAKGIEIVGKRAFVCAGNDTHIFTQEGVRSIARMAGSGGDFEVSAPLSQPMQTYINRINWAYASKIAGTKYKNFILWAVPLDNATEPDYVLVYNIRLNAWCGVWKSLSPCCFGRTAFAAVERLVLGDNNGRVKVWKDYADETLSATFQDDATDIATLFRTKSFCFAEPESPKDGEFYWAEFSPDSQGLVSVGIYLDETLARTDVHNLAQIQNQLPVNLPFDLASLKPTTKVESLIGLENFKEEYFEFTSTAGKLALKRFVSGAFINPLFTDAG
jgi:hypothetical protein